MTVEDALKRIRRTGPDKETINICYVTDDARHLLGSSPSARCCCREEDDIIGDIMDTNVIYANTLEDQETVAMNLNKYDFLALPVVDHGKPPGGHRHRGRRHGRLAGGGHRGYREDGGHAALRQALSQNRRH